MPARVKKSGKMFIVIDANTGKKISTSGRFKENIILSQVCWYRTNAGILSDHLWRFLLCSCFFIRSKANNYKN